MIRLAYFDSNDFTQLMDWIKDEEALMNWSGSLFSYPLTQSSLEWYIEDVNDIEESEAFIYKAIEQDTQKVVGHISLGGVSKKKQVGKDQQGIDRSRKSGQRILQTNGTGCFKNWV